MNHEIDVSPSGQTVWVNSSEGCCIGRFDKRFGLDIHRNFSEQVTGQPQCLFCTHEPAGPEEWKLFCTEMLKHYKIVIPPNTITYEPTHELRQSL